MVLIENWAIKKGRSSKRNMPPLSQRPEYDTYITQM